jgi:hypothetical protein
MSGGHAYTLAGWKQLNGETYVGMMNNWGEWGHPQGRFYFPVRWLFSYPLGPQLVWKTVDIDDAVIPPPPQPEGSHMQIIEPQVMRQLQVPLGKNIYDQSGKKVLTTLQSVGPAGVASPFAFYGGFYGVVISTGGVLTVGAIKASDVSSFVDC